MLLEENLLSVICCLLSRKSAMSHPGEELAGFFVDSLFHRYDDDHVRYDDQSRRDHETERRSI